MNPRIRICGIGVIALFLFAGVNAFPQHEKTYFNPKAKPIPAGSKIYIAPMSGGFQDFVAAAIMEKKVPVVLVDDPSQAAYEITGVSESEKANWAKMLLMKSEQSAEQASIEVLDLNSGHVVFAYSVNKINSVRGKQSAAEACAKHLKKKIDTKRRR